LTKPYELTATRLENRGNHPPTREYVDLLVEALTASGVEACWNSAVSPRGTPFFPSRVFPVHHPQADAGVFRYLTDRLHAIDRPVLSWYALNLGGGVLTAHPDWAIRFYKPEGTTSDPAWDDAYACISSPYGELLPRFVAEVVAELGFDGIWFDGSTFANHNATPGFSQPGCRCDHCRARFRRDTGLPLPEKLDASDPAFRPWVAWRYDLLMDVWKRCVDAVAEANPRAVVCFNNYRRRPFGGWQTGIPLRTLGWDALMSTELDGFPGQADIQMKMCRATGLTRGAESWWPLCDHWNVWVPDHEPLTAVQAALGCIAAGGVASSGVGVDPRLMAGVLGVMEQAAAPRMPYAGGETVPYAAILASQNTMDFYASHTNAWDGIHGANEFCRHSHLQSSVVFDDTVAGEGAASPAELSRYPALLLGNAACVGAAQAERITAYAEAGGIVVACHEAGTRDEWGEPHTRPILDALLGIRSRMPGRGAPTLELLDAGLIGAAGHHVTFRGAHTLAQPAEDVQVLAHVVDRMTGHWDGFEDGPLAEPPPRLPGWWVRPAGRGYAVYMGVNLFEHYLHAPTGHMMRMLRALLVRLAPPTVTADAPLCVTVNTRVQADGRWAVHLHNAPGTAYAYPNPAHGHYLHAPGEVTPVYGIRLRVSGPRVTAARLALSGATLAVQDNGVDVPRLDLHEVVLLEVGGK
jgi:hypothetical protein